MQVQLVLVLTVVLLLMVFTFQNPYPVQMRFMGWQTGEIPIIMVIVFSVLIGVIVSLLLGLKQAKQQKKTIRHLQTEIDELKTPPVTPEEE